MGSNRFVSPEVERHRTMCSKEFEACFTIVAIVYKCDGSDAIGSETVRLDDSIKLSLLSRLGAEGDTWFFSCIPRALFSIRDRKNGKICQEPRLNISLVLFPYCKFDLHGVD